MSLKLVEILVLGQVLRLNVPVEQEELLRQAARNLDILVSEMKEKTGLIQLDRVLSIVALNLSFELTQEKNKNTTNRRCVENEKSSNWIILRKCSSIKRIKSVINCDLSVAESLMIFSHFFIALDTLV